jgi:hypothetical protein
MNLPVSVLTAKDQDIVRETEPKRMAKLDEDELLALHDRLRRARNRNVKNYRRQAASRVADRGGRGAAKPENTHARDRAEVMEDALARVSGRLEVLARESAEALKAERLAAAQANRSTGPGAGAPATVKSSGGTTRSAKKTTGGLKRDASTLAKGARRQAKKDSR